MSKGSAVLPDGSFDKKLTKLFIGDIEKILDDMDSHKGEYMSRCKSRREDIAAILDRAKDSGIPKKIMNEHIKRRILEGKLEALGTFDDDEDTTKYKQVGLALGDFSIEDVAVKAKKPRGMPGAEAAATH